MTFLKLDTELRFRSLAFFWGCSALVLGGAVWFLFGNVCRSISALTVGGVSLLPYLSQSETSRLTHIAYAAFGTAFLGMIVFSGLPLLFREHFFDIQTLDLIASVFVMVIYIRIAVAQIAPGRSRRTPE